MSTRNNSNPGPLGLISIKAPHESHMELMQSNHAPSHEERRITGELGRQILIIEGQREKTIFGSSAIGDIHAHGSYVFQDTVTSIIEKHREIRGEDFEPYIREFNRVNIESCAKDLLAAAGTGSENIGSVIDKSLDLPPRPSLWTQLSR